MTAADRLRGWLLLPAAKPLAIALGLLPLTVLAAGVLTHGWSAAPPEPLIQSLGLWALRLLCLALAITPLHIHTKTPQLVRYQRLLDGLVFFYASLHLLAYLGLSAHFSVLMVAHDVIGRPPVLVGLVAWLLLLPLAFTANNAAVRRLGGRQWQALHGMIHLVAVFVLLHFWWLRSMDGGLGGTWFYGLVIVILLLERLNRHLVAQVRRRSS